MVSIISDLYFALQYTNAKILKLKRQTENVKGHRGFESEPKKNVELINCLRQQKEIIHLLDEEIQKHFPI